MSRYKPRTHDREAHATMKAGEKAFCYLCLLEKRKTEQKTQKKRPLFWQDGGP